VEKGPDRDLIRMRHALLSLVNDLGAFLDEFGMEPAADSLAAKEQEESSKGEQLLAAYSQGHLLLESAADHAIALARLLEEPVTTMAPWTCMRAGIESAAMSCWLLSSQITAAERISRSFAFRYDGLSQQLKCARTSNNMGAVRDILARMDETEAQALSLGYQPILDKKNKRAGIGQRMPSATQCVATILDEEKLYRISSAVVHAHPWALIQVGFHAPDPNRPDMLKKSLSKTSAALFLLTALDFLAKPAWAEALLFGYNPRLLSGILERRYEEMGIDKCRRFWTC